MAASAGKLGQRIDALMEQASAALVATRYFECERSAAEALRLAFDARDYDRMARILMPLEESRRQKRLIAADAGQVHRLDVPRRRDGEEERHIDLRPGCWLVAPPLVGADGRELRRRLDEAEAPAIVIVREPQTRTGLWPIVMVGPTTVRAKVHPPEPLAAQWFLEASEALGDEAIAEVELTLPGEVRVERLMERLLTLQDHDRLHQALADACTAASRDAAGGSPPGRRRRASGAKAPESADA